MDWAGVVSARRSMIARADMADRIALILKLTQREADVVLVACENLRESLEADKNPVDVPLISSLRVVEKLIRSGE